MSVADLIRDMAIDVVREKAARPTFFACGLPNAPVNCKCWDSGTWIVVDIPPVCSTYEEDSGGGCSNCQHEERCHT